MLTAQKNLVAKRFSVSALIIALLLAVSLTGCKKRDEKDLSIYDETLVGIDKDNNGIRDEIEERMKQEWHQMITKEEQLVMNQHARVFDDILHVDLNDKDKVLRIRDHLDMAINCGVLVFGEDMRYHNFSINLTYLQQWYFNTKERRERKHEFIMRAREYHYQTTNFEGANTCDFEFSDALKQEIERRKAEKAKKEQLAKEEAKSQEKQN